MHIFSTTSNFQIHLSGCGFCFYDTKEKVPRRKRESEKRERGCCDPKAVQMYS